MTHPRSLQTHARSRPLLQMLRPILTHPITTHLNCRLKKLIVLFHRHRRLLARLAAAIRHRFPPTHLFRIASLLTRLQLRTRARISYAAVDLSFHRRGLQALDAGLLEGEVGILRRHALAKLHGLHPSFLLYPIEVLVARVWARDFGLVFYKSWIISHLYLKLVISCAISRSLRIEHVV